MHSCWLWRPADSHGMRRLVKKMFCWSSIVWCIYFIISVCLCMGMLDLSQRICKHYNPNQNAKEESKDAESSSSLLVVVATILGCCCCWDPVILLLLLCLPLVLFLLLFSPVGMFAFIAAVFVDVTTIFRHVDCPNLPYPV